MDRRRAIDHDVVVVRDKLADLPVHGATGRRQTNHRSREGLVFGRLSGPPRGRSLLVHIDQQRLTPPQTKGSGDVHADRGLATATFLIEYRYDLGAHWPSTFSAESQQRSS